MNNISNRLLLSGLSAVLGVGVAVSGATVWTLMSQDAVQASSCSGVCSSDTACNPPGTSGCVCKIVGGSDGSCASGSGGIGS
jgi:hypothetical protein